MDGEPDTGSTSMSMIRDRIAKLPPVAKVGAVAVLILAAIWAISS